MSNDSLMPCPGCGGNDVRVIGGPGTKGGPKHWAGCAHCHWRTWGSTEVEAIEAWNRRAITPDVEHHTAKLREEIEALRKEAERYRWLRDNCVRYESVNHDSDNMELHFRFNHLFREPDLGFAIDMRMRAAIDAARGGE